MLFVVVADCRLLLCDVVVGWCLLSLLTSLSLAVCCRWCVLVLRPCLLSAVVRVGVGVCCCDCGLL